MSIKSLPTEERPRERLMHRGLDAVSLVELFAIVLVNGTKGKSVLELSQELLAHFGSVERLFDASIAELREIKGIGEAKAIQLKAIFGIFLKCRAQPDYRSPVSSHIEAYAIAKVDLEYQKQEVLLVLLRDVRGCLIHREQVSIGTLSHLLAHPREVFYPAVRYKAHSLILAHNHPSGDPTPSLADIELTHSLMHSGKVMGIHVDDHIIIGRDRYTSLRARGLMGDKVKY